MGAACKNNTCVTQRHRYAYVSDEQTCSSGTIPKSEHSSKAGSDGERRMSSYHQGTSALLSLIFCNHHIQQGLLCRSSKLLITSLIHGCVRPHIWLSERNESEDAIYHHRCYHINPRQSHHPRTNQTNVCSSQKQHMCHTNA